MPLHVSGDAAASFTSLQAKTARILGADSRPASVDMPAEMRSPQPVAAQVLQSRLARCGVINAAHFCANGAGVGIRDLFATSFHGACRINSSDPPRQKFPPQQVVSSRFMVARPSKDVSMRRFLLL